MNSRSSVFLRVILVLGFFLSLTGGLTHPVSAITTCTWDGDVSTDWFTADNWSCDDIPLSTEYDVIIPNIVSINYPKLDSSGVGVNSIVINTGAQLFVDPNPNTAIGITTNSFVINEGAQLLVDASNQAVVRSASFTNKGTINIVDNIGSSLKIYGGVFNNQGTVNIGTYQSWLILLGSGTHSGDFIGNRLNFNQPASRQTNIFTSGSTIDVRQIWVLGDHDIDVDGSFDCSHDFTIRNDSHVTISTDGIIDVGNVSVEDTSTLNFRMTGGSFDPGETLEINSGESLVGEGTIQANLVNAGTVSPGTSPGTITVQGNYTQESGGTLAIELGGATPGTEHDQLVITGTATLDGTLDVTMVSGFTPVLDDSFTIMTYTAQTGRFNTTALPSLSAGLGWLVDYQDTALVLRVVETGTISGTVTYVGGEGYNPVTIGLFVDPGDPPVLTEELNSTTGEYPYNFTDLPIGTYYVGALMDLDSDHEPDPNEPFAWYDADENGAPDAVDIQSGDDVTGIDIVLGDPLTYVYLPLILR